MSKGDWDWYGNEEKTDIVFPSVQAVAVYGNPDGDVVIRQQGAMGEDDTIIIVPRLNVDAIIAAIKTAAVQSA